MANRRRGRGSVDGVPFKNYREAIYLIVSKYLEKNPFISYIEFVENTREIQDFSINDNNDRSFIKTEIAYYRLPQNLQRRFYDSRPLNIEGKNYYLKTETDEKHALEVIDFGLKNGISVIVVNNQFNNVRVKIINSQLLPSKVEEDRFIYFIEQLPIIKDHDFFSLAAPIIIELSDLRPIRTYGKYTLDDVKNILIKKIKEKNYEYADDWIERINNAESKDDLLNLASPIAEMIMDRDIDDGYKKALEMIQDLIGQIKFTVNILGGFNYIPCWKYDKLLTENEKIILYVKNIEACQNSYGGVFNAFKAVISHEMFHCFHCFKSKHSKLYPYEFSHRSDYLADVIIESLASYYEYFVCSVNQIPNDLIYSWNSCSIKIYPYSGAKYISDIDEWEKILVDSFKHGMNHAFFDLIKKDFILYYYIINKNSDNYVINNDTKNNNNKSSTCLDEFYKFLLVFCSTNDANKYISAIQKVCMDCNLNIDDLNLYLVKKIINEYNTFRSEENRNSNGELVLSLKYFILFIKMNSFFKQKNNANDNQQSYYDEQALNTWHFIPFNYSSDYRNKSFDINQQFYSYIDILLKEKSLSKEEFIKKCELRDDFFNMNFIDLETIFKICIKLELNLDQGTILLKQFNYKLDENYFIDELLIVCLDAGIYNIDSLNSIFKYKCNKKIFNIDE